MDLHPPAPPDRPEPDHPTGSHPSGTPPEPQLQHAPSPPHAAPPVWPKAVLGLLLLLILAGGAYYFFFRDREPAVPPPPEQEESVGEETPATAGRRAEPPIELPPLPESDPVVRQLVSGLSSHPRLAAWLATDELVQRFVVTVDNLAEGRSPAVHLPFLEPETGFQVQESGDRLAIDPATYRRYDLLAEAFVSLDTEGTARLYRQLEPLIDEAYRNLGYPDRDFDDTLAQAMGRLLAVPVVEEEVALEAQGVAYDFADPELESLSPAAKHLLRTGPDNVRRIQAKIRELAQAMGITPRPDGR